MEMPKFLNPIQINRVKIPLEIQCPMEFLKIISALDIVIKFRFSIRMPYAYRYSCILKFAHLVVVMETVAELVQ